MYYEPNNYVYTRLYIRAIFQLDICVMCYKDLLRIKCHAFETVIKL